MSFVNEKISLEDRIKFNIDGINDTYHRRNLDWTIDRDRSIYLREVAADREERQGYVTWNFCWNGELIEMVMYTSDISEDPATPGVTWNIERYGILDQSKRKDFLAHEDEFFVILKEALMVYQLGGVFMKKPFDKFEVTIKVDPAFLIWRSKRNG
ncbi:MAG: hypothetical protein CVU36_23510 [Betaproteobacteria bacterium HGW-Betaproteobacteria-9]|jgi:hypothetical protein|nr:MAG: hypothetical protein CVU36_23510 [Betaproteobacteria bacterium HGW-Betaproteobacteria-9]